MTPHHALHRFVDAQDAGRAPTTTPWPNCGPGADLALDVVHVPATSQARAQRDGQRWRCASLDEARDYLARPVLGTNLRRCADDMLDLPPTATGRGVLGGIER